MFAFRDSCACDPDPDDGVRVEVAFTDASLNLQGLREGFAADLASLVAATGVRFARLSQVHGDEVVHVVDEPSADLDDDVPSADALVTTRRRTGLMVRAADCVPVLLADPAAGVIGAVHAGRVGVRVGVVTRTIERMRDLGAGQLRAWVGPHVCGRCYEVPATMREEVASIVPQTYAETSWGTPALDLGAGVDAQLSAERVSVVRVGRCTREDPELHSYRRDGAASGRLAGLVWIA